MSAAVRDQPEPVAQPLHDRAADEHAAFERVLRAVADLPRDGRDELMARRGRRGADVLQQEAAGAVGVLRHPGAAAHLAEQRRLLIAGDAGDRHARDAERGRRPRRSARSTRAPRAASLRGTPNRSSSSSSHCSAWMLNSIVREALVTSVTCSRPLVSFQISQVSIVPKASRPASARARAPGTLSRIQRILLAEKYASMSSPVFRWISGAAPSAFSRSQKSAVRRSCQTMALWIGSPVSRSQTIGRLALVGDADGGDVAAAAMPARPSASTATPICDAQISCGSCSTQPARGKDLREFLLRDGTDAAVAGRRRWRASWSCPDRARGCTACAARVYNGIRIWSSIGTVAWSDRAAGSLGSMQSHDETAGRVSRHVRADRLRRRRRRADGAEPAPPAAAVDQHRLGPRGHDGVLRVGRSHRRASESCGDARARRPSPLSVAQGGARTSLAQIGRRVRRLGRRLRHLSRGADRVRRRRAPGRGRAGTAGIWATYPQPFLSTSPAASSIRSSARRCSSASSSASPIRAIPRRRPASRRSSSACWSC